MHVGFTGTQKGMTPEQAARVRHLLRTLGATALRHGDCIGADADAHDITLGLGLPIYIHPPIDDKKRAFCAGASEIMPLIKESPSVDARGNVRTVCPSIANARPKFDPKYYLLRDHQIVDWSYALVACPKSDRELLRSGTWATVRYARKQGKPICIVYPDGRVEIENEFKLLGRDAA